MFKTKTSHDVSASKPLAAEPSDAALLTYSCEHPAVWSLHRYQRFAGFGPSNVPKLLDELLEHLEPAMLRNFTITYSAYDSLTSWTLGSIQAGSRPLRQSPQELESSSSKSYFIDLYCRSTVPPKSANMPGGRRAQALHQVFVGSHLHKPTPLNRSQLLL